MGTVKGTWLLPSHSGRACNHEDIYTKMNKKTGKCYSVKLCNPNFSTTSGQATQRTAFGIISSAIAAWITDNKLANTAAYKTLKRLFDRQTKYATLRGFMMAKDMAKLEADGSVTITIKKDVPINTTPIEGGYGGTTPSGGGTSGSTSGGGATPSTGGGSGDDGME